ncbi:MAG: motA, partial [Firmicutes bacterium]|nr:motA [Bacillota bacterium]
GNSGIFSLDFPQLINFVDVASVFIVIGCTFAVVVASFPKEMFLSMPKHFAIMLNTKRYEPLTYIKQLVELAQVARKNGLLALEEQAMAQKDPFFQQAIMLIVDANDPDKVRSILMNDIETTSERHGSVIGMYERGAAIAPAFGMIGTLIGLIKMLKAMSPEEGGADAIGPAMAVALITTLYGCILAHMVFTPIASNLQIRDEEEVLCRMIIVEGVMSIQSGENPKFLEEDGKSKGKTKPSKGKGKKS